MTDLKPCPFCGGEAHFQAQQGDNPEPIAWDVVHHCAAGGFIRMDPRDSKYRSTKAEAAAAWNTRADIHDRGFANSVDFLQRQGRDADIISEAISTYDEWMLDDDFEAMPVLERIISRMKERRSFSADVATLRAEVERLREAGDRLSFCAQTSGGTAGRDEDLIASIDRWQEVRATPCACQSGSESGGALKP